MPEQRHCGSCTLCRRLLPVRELQKPANTRCQHQSSKGCGIYRRPGFPASCALWSCRWLLGHETEGLPRPDRCGWVIDVMPDIVRMRNDATGDVHEVEIVQVWVEPGVDALKDRRLLRYIERQGERGSAVLLRHGSAQATAVFGSALASDGKLHIIDQKQMVRAETQTGNMLLDRAKEAIDAAERLGDRTGEAVQAQGPAPAEPS